MPRQKEPVESVYLGDGVYARFDGHHVVLGLDSHLNEHGQIYLEFSVFKQLLQYGGKCFNLYVDK